MESKILEVMKKAIKDYGKEAQVFVAIEELSEFITELINSLSNVKGKFTIHDVDIRRYSGDIKDKCKEIRKKQLFKNYIFQPINKKQIIDEMADSLIMIEQIKLSMNLDEKVLQDQISFKMERLRQRLEGKPKED